MGTEVKIKKWGNSLGIILPKELVEERKLKKGEKVNLEIIKKADLRDIFGTLKTGLTGQQFKDLARNGWK